ncbi:MAG: ABC transporter ATP-binding protein [Acidimicrobiaceae bacterium]|nr:ABC transporter ATP-binding protein [Acidimicrobiaceae bacterium]MYG54811.1 ABC transporter ATP-binding protein [Acidimicrobiaceae bacterium]MYJ99209.1 ABC transporter ATP-binding protein [Acidimicrobiaceae bacterium]
MVVSRTQYVGGVTLLETRGLSVEFGGVVALDHVDLALESGSLTGLIGPNGAGKTTFIDAVTGMVGSSGRVLLDGVDISHHATHQRVEKGLVRTFQTLELFEDLTVEQNLLAAAERTGWWQFISDAVRPRKSTSAAATVGRSLELVGLSDQSRRLPADLSGGQRRLVGVARALAASPQLLLLDEPAAGLDSSESLILGQQIRTIADTGVTILLVDHDMGLVLDVCELIHVLDFGNIIARGSPQQIQENPAVVAAYLGKVAEQP